MKIGDSVCLTANAQRADGTANAVPVAGVIDHIEPTRYGPRYRVRHSDGTCTVADAEALSPCDDKYLSVPPNRVAYLPVRYQFAGRGKPRRLTPAEYAATWI